ncbi:shikimate kinase [Gracilimonas sp. Q87]|uniref:shikimate kinase n=1 Tax=Gracilimonas sp. Q87 TaxID=3384766 RepID=UPI0039842844
MRNRVNSFDQSIYVTGFMASGKSTLAKALAAELQMKYKDLDEEIEKREGKSIQAIFDEMGEPYFREKEREYLIDLTYNFKGVVSLGGGALQDQMIVDHLKINGLLLCVKTPFAEIMERVKSSSERPILYDEEGKIKSDATLKTELKTLYYKRLNFYEQAQIKVDSSKYGSKNEMVKAATDKIKRHV